MAIIFKTYELQKGQNFLRISHSNSTDELSVKKIIPHDDVYDGYELTVLMTAPESSTAVIYFGPLRTPQRGCINPLHDTLGNNLSDPQLIHRYINNASPSPLTLANKIFKFIWDEENEWWIEVSRGALLS